MTARPWVRARRGGDGDEAVSTVLGAILMFGLLLTTLAVVQVKFVPIWDKQRERDAGIEVGTQVAAVKADLDRIARNQTTVGLTETVSLTRAQGFSFFGSNLLPGSVAYTPTSSSAGLTVSTLNPVTLQQAGGTALYDLNDDFTSFAASTQKTGIVGISHIRFRVPNPNGLPTGTQTFDFLVTDTNDKCVGEVKLVATGVTLTAKTIEAQVFAAQSPPATACQASPYQAETTYIGTATPSYYYYDPILRGGFAQVLAAAPSSSYPLKAIFTQGNTAGQTAFVYDQSTAYGTVRTGGTGLAYSSFNQFTATGVLQVVVNNNQLPAQTFGLEYGAVFLTQNDGDAMVAPPIFSVGTTTTQAGLSWSVPALTGGSAAVTGARAATVAAAPAGGASAIQLSAQDITFTIATTHGAAWAAFWTERMQLGGLSSTPMASQAPCLDTTTLAPQYTVAYTSTSATLNFYGPCASTAPGETTKDVLVTLRQGGVAIDLRPAG